MGLFARWADIYVTAMSRPCQTTPRLVITYHQRRQPPRWATNRARLTPMAITPRFTTRATTTCRILVTYQIAFSHLNKWIFMTLSLSSSVWFIWHNPAFHCYDTIIQRFIHLLRSTISFLWHNPPFHSYDTIHHLIPMTQSAVSFLRHNPPFDSYDTIRRFIPMAQSTVSFP